MNLQDRLDRLVAKYRALGEEIVALEQDWRTHQAIDHGCANCGGGPTRCWTNPPNKNFCDMDCAETWQRKYNGQEQTA